MATPTNENIISNSTAMALLKDAKSIGYEDHLDGMIPTTHAFMMGALEELNRHTRHRITFKHNHLVFWNNSDLNN